MKRLIQLDPDTYEPAGTICTFKMVGERVVITPAAAANRSSVKSIRSGDELLTPDSGRAYYDALEQSLHGSYYFVEAI